jgi:xanthine dehydrogenase YagR molybdenum-binding subunit
MSILGKIVETVAHVMPDRDPDELIQRHRYLGQPIGRLDGRSKVTGAAHFSADYPVNGLVHAALAFSTISKGAIVTIDTSAAEQAPGVLSVMVATT